MWHLLSVRIPIRQRGGTKTQTCPKKKTSFSTSATWSVRSVLAVSSRDIRQQSRLFLPSWYERWIIEFERTSPYQFGTGAFPVGPTTPGKLSPSSPTAIHPGVGHQTATSVGLQWPSSHTVHDILATSCNLINSQSSPSPTSPLCATVNNNHHHGHHHHHHQSNDNAASNNNNEETSGYHHPHHHHHHQQYYASALYHHHHHHSDTVTPVATTSPVLTVQSIMMQSSATNSQPASPCNWKDRDVR